MRALFIGGCGRSGTTMLGDLLGVPPAHICTPETTFKWGLVHRWRWPDDARDAIGWLTRYPKFRELGIDVRPLALETLPLREALEAIVREYGRSLGRPDGELWIDHTPINIRMGKALAELFPDARFIDLVRDGRAIAASVIPLDWGPNDVIAAAEDWTRSLAHGLSLATTFPDRVMRVRYEDLVTDPATVLAKICAFAGIAYDPRMVDGGGFRLPQSLAKQHALVGQRPDASRLDAWRTKLTPREVEIFEAIVGELLPLHGYTPDFGERARPPSSLVELYYGTRDRLLGLGWNRLRKRRRLQRAGFQPRTESS